MIATVPHVTSGLGLKFQVDGFLLTRVYNGQRFSCPEVKRPSRCVNHPPTCNAEVKDRIKLYYFSLLEAWGGVVFKALRY